MSLTGRLSEDDYRELARLVRVIHADAAAWRERERERQDASQDGETRRDAGTGDDPA
jgi:hypothetical protein